MGPFLTLKLGIQCFPQAVVGLVGIFTVAIPTVVTSQDGKISFIPIYCLFFHSEELEVGGVEVDNKDSLFPALNLHGMSYGQFNNIVCVVEAVPDILSFTGGMSVGYEVKRAVLDCQLSEEYNMTNRFYFDTAGLDEISGVLNGGHFDNPLRTI